MCWTEPEVAARTAVHTAASLRLGPGRQATTTALGHAIDGDGDLLVAVSERQITTLAMFATGGAGELVSGTAEAVDLAPVALADRVRRTVRLHGSLVALSGAAQAAARRLVSAREHQRDPLVWDADARLLRLEPTSITLVEHCRCDERADPRGVERHVDVHRYLAAQVDPLVDVEPDWLCHLAADHEPTLMILAACAAPELDHIGFEVSPLGVDRTGLRLRVRTATGTRDLHLAFDQPVACPCEANHAVNALFVRASAVP